MNTNLVKYLSIALTLAIYGCGSVTNSEPSQTQAEIAEVTGDTLVSVQWKLCLTDPEGVFPDSTLPRNTDEQGCRHNQTKPMVVWPTNEGTVEVFYIRNRGPVSPGSPTSLYSLATYSRGCRDEPGEEGYYRAGEVISISHEWLNGRDIVEIEDVELAPFETSEDGIADPGVLIFGGSCGLMNLDYLGIN